MMALMEKSVHISKSRVSCEQKIKTPIEVKMYTHVAGEKDMICMENAVFLNWQLNAEMHS